MAFSLLSLIHFFHLLGRPSSNLSRVLVSLVTAAKTPFQVRSPALVHALMSCGEHNSTHTRYECWCPQWTWQAHLPLFFSWRPTRRAYSRLHTPASHIHSPFGFPLTPRQQVFESFNRGLISALDNSQSRSLKLWGSRRKQARAWTSGVHHSLPFSLSLHPGHTGWLCQGCSNQVFSQPQS